MFHPYGLVIALAVLAGYLVAYFRKEKYGLTSDDLETLFLLIIPLGVIGARVYHVLDKWSYYSHNVVEIMAVWNGGLGIYGAVVGGLIGIWIFTNRFVILGTPPHGGGLHNQIGNGFWTLRRLPDCQNDGKYVTLLDFLMPSLALGQAIGRWGNFFNYEVFGPPTSFFGKWYIPQNLRPEMWKNYEFFHPVFLYESLWVFIGFIVLLLIENGNLARVRNFLCSAILSRNKVGTNHNLGTRSQKRTTKNFYHSPSCLIENNGGFLTGFYSFWYGWGRFFLEFLRWDTAELWGVKTAQIISLLLVIWGIKKMYITIHGRMF